MIIRFYYKNCRNRPVALVKEAGTVDLNNSLDT